MMLRASLFAVLTAVAVRRAKGERGAVSTSSTGTKFLAGTTSTSTGAGSLAKMDEARHLCPNGSV